MRRKLQDFSSFLGSSRKTLLLILIVTIASIIVTTTIAMLLSKTTDLYIPSLGTVKTIGVEAYWDPTTENKTEKIDWGTIVAGTSRNVILHIKSISNYDVTLLLNATDWIPTKISYYMTLSWDYNGTTLSPGEIVPVTLTLSASYSNSFIRYLIDNDVQSYSFAIHIAANDLD